MAFSLGGCDCSSVATLCRRLLQWVMVGQAASTSASSAWPGCTEPTLLGSDPRSKADADPPQRAGSAAYHRQAARFAKAAAEHKPGQGRKPESMDYDSCVARPLFNFSMMEISRIPLHLFLGLGTQQIALLELRLKSLDAIWAEGRGKELSNPKWEAELQEQKALVIECRRAAENHYDNATSLQNSIEAAGAEDTTSTDEAKLKKTRIRKLRAELDVAQKAQRAAEKASDAAKKQVQKYYDREAGPFMRGLYVLLDSYNLERQV